MMSLFPPGAGGSGQSVALPCVEDRPGFVVPAWSRSDGLGAAPVCLSPWRRAVDAGELIVEAAEIGPDDVFVDLGSGDGSVVTDVVRRTGCVGVGIEAASDLVAVSTSRVGELPADVGWRVVFLHELIGSRGLVGATVVFTWLLEPAAELVSAVVRDALPAGGLRVVLAAGQLGPALGLRPMEVVGRLRSDFVKRPAGGLSASIRYPDRGSAPTGADVDSYDLHRWRRPGAASPSGAGGSASSVPGVR